MDYQKVFEQQKTYQLSQKSIGLTIVLTFLFRPIGFAYTGRWKKFFISVGIDIITTFVLLIFAALIGGMSGLSGEDLEGAIGAIWIVLIYLYALVIGIYWIVENTQAVSQAKVLINQKNQFTETNRNIGFDTPSSNEVEKLKIQLLQYMKLKKDVTVADCIIETGSSGNQVRSALGELQSERLIVMLNDSNGVMTYSIR